jgi:hypothetical protein
VISETHDASISVIVHIHFLEDILLELIKNKPLQLIHQESILISD